MVDDILNFSPGTESRMAFINQTGSNNAALEFIQCSIPGKPLSDIAQPPCLGLFAIAFAVDDISALIQKLRANNIKMLSEPVKISLENGDRVRAIIVEAPNGVHLQFFE